MFTLKTCNGQSLRGKKGNHGNMIIIASLYSWASRTIANAGDMKYITHYLAMEMSSHLGILFVPQVIELISHHDVFDVNTSRRY
jgi:hypothetical protein